MHKAIKDCSQKIFKDFKWFSWGFICIGLLLTSTACQQSKEEAYNKLSDQQKHMAKNAMLAMDVNDGLEGTLFASEDMLVNPTNMDIDEKGRVWITEGYNYRPSRNPENPVDPDGDKIVILEDTDHDGKADSRKVYYQGNDINAALGIMVMGNKVIVSRSPNVFVFTDTNGDDKPDKKEVLFTGIEGIQHDHAVHAFVFGPDGKYYFNMGNAGHVIKDKDGHVIVDKYGHKVQMVKNGGDTYRQGMVFRCNPDGSEFEVLADNFRNNYEVAVDSYGTLWQSDNDDDGNKGVVINYVMEFGNYGYTDEMTGAGWRTRRTGMAEKIPIRHWHQNDPGVVPNLLYTGAGSPTGIVAYEGHLLPKVFQNQIIHTDAGPNVVRAYPVTKDGAGYDARIENIMKARDQWFRPSDVTVAPDGSILVADWYDPGVGGHQMGDQKRGRIFRIAPPNTPYEIPTYDYNTPGSTIEALKNPNLSIRAKAWKKLHAWGTKAEPALVGLWHSDNPRYRARALWLLSKIDGKGTQYIDEALNDDNPDIRITGLRAARELNIDIIPYVKRLVDDSSPQVRRDAAIALRYNKSAEAADLWAQLAMHHDGKDRWYLEALGIGAENQWDRYFDTWMQKKGTNWKDKAGRDIVWRSRAKKAIPMLAELIEDPDVPESEKPRYFRAFDFHTDPSKEDVLVNLLDGNRPDQTFIRMTALQHLKPTTVKQPKVKKALNVALEQAKGSYDYLDLVRKFELKDHNEELLSLMMAHPDSSLGVNAGRTLIDYGGDELIAGELNSGDTNRRDTAIEALSHVGNSQARDLLQALVLDNSKSTQVREDAVKAIGSGWSGENRLLSMVKDGMIPPKLQSAAGDILLHSYRDGVRKEAAKYLKNGNDSGKTSLQPVAELVKMKGHAENGKKVFQRTCEICHQVNGEGTQFGPDLSEIGSKLPKQGLYEAILQPNAGISFGYEGYILTLNNGSKVAGIIDSETNDDLVLRTTGGYTNEYKKSDIKSREEMSSSFMPENLESGMSQDEMVDLVEYLSSLKKSSAKL